MSEYLLIGGEKNGQIVRWPRHDQAPAIFPRLGAGFPSTTGPYWPHEIRAQDENDRPAYRVATPAGYLHPTDHARIAYRLLALPLEDLARVRIAPSKPWTCPTCHHVWSHEVTRKQGDRYAGCSRCGWCL